MTDLATLERLARSATPGPWCIESCGEKGDGSNMIGVAFGPDDTNAEHPLSGWLRDFDVEGNEIEYYRDALVAECEHRNPNAGNDAAFIAACDPQTILSLIARVKTLERMDREAATYCEVPIAMRTDFTGDEPYVGWKGLGKAMEEAFDERDALTDQGHVARAGISGSAQERGTPGNGGGVRILPI